MSARLFATAGSKLFIGPAKAFTGTDFTASDFTSTTWTEIGGTTNLGATGDTAELITSTQISDARVRKMKGTRNAGSATIVCDVSYDDPGQLALIAAEKTEDSYAFKLQFNDAPAGGTPSIRYFVALVMGASEELNEANNIAKLNVTLEIDSNIVRVAAAASGG
ncbi:phage tail tube protein [Blastochloris viridis]|uniref:Phage tail protein n=1 Tax=Blastochloris viridis TaxID=1079 RepID=A0A0H5BEH4_BLAVI|nr:phage tail tube protein [Blastochloris viridis]ALK09500.1 hypothetical protein BVIR_1724 [Blastochloris viridis]BAS00616.1 hypothetical protein BV133_3022 [Blastochloris viridis]CUU42163.1 hypothetical protein BVIRIDIS_11690 [Blastochloris viridis]